MNETRHYCRNPRCRSKLAAPVENIRLAFCTRTCHSVFYRQRCMACEQPMERKNVSQRLCGRRKCRAEFEALKQHAILGRYWDSPEGKADARKPINTGTFSPVSSGPRWRQLAGPAMTAEQLRLATVGAADVLRSNRTANRRLRNPTTLIGPGDAPLNLIGGYRFPNAKAVEVVPASECAEVAPRRLVAG